MTKRCAGVSSFGFGGTNAHIVIEEFIGDQSESALTTQSRGKIYEGKNEAIILSAKNKDQLIHVAENLEQFLEDSINNHSSDDFTITEIATALQQGREALDWRVGFASKQYQRTP